MEGLAGSDLNMRLQMRVTAPLCWHYSYLSATKGSTRVARRAGM
jgi:hypothetical protein